MHSRGDDDQGDPLKRRKRLPDEVKHLFDARRAGGPFLAYRDATKRLTIYPLSPARDRVTIGRSPDADICLEWDGKVSALHAALERLAGEWTVVDRGFSRNGTFVNTRRVHEGRLRDNDRIRVGHTVIVYEEGNERTLAATAGGEAFPSPSDLTPAQLRIARALCRPSLEANALRSPALDKEVEEELVVSHQAVRRHLTALYAKFGLGELKQGEKRFELQRILLREGFFPEWKGSV
jgi:hypothetical protein